MPSSTPARALLVLGMHRSGTSALTRTLSLLGAALPQQLMGAKEENNALGFWEPQAVYELNEALLRQLGSRWDDWQALPAPSAEHVPGPIYREQVSILRREYAQAPLAVLKDPRMCRLLPYWTQALVDAGFSPAAVLALRHPLEVADSLQRRDGFSINRGLLLWLRHSLDAERHSRQLPRSVVDYAELLQQWQGTTARLGQQLNLDWPVEAASAKADIEAFLSSKHRHEQRPTEALQSDPQVFAWVRQAWALLGQLKQEPQHAPTLEALDALREQFEAATAVFGPEWQQSEEDKTAQKEQLARADKSLRDSQAHAGRLEHKVQQLQQEISDRTVQWERQRAQHQAEQKAMQQRVDDARQTESSLRTAIRQLDRSLEQERQAHAAARQKAGSAEARAKRADLQAQRSGNAATEALSQAQDLRRAVSAHWQQGLRLCALQAKRGQLRGWLRLSADPRSTLRAQRLARRIRAQGLFDAAWYLNQYPDLQADRQDPLLHWCLVGWTEGRSPLPGFDPRWYLSRYDDIAAAGINPLEHYLQHGWMEGRRPSPAFDPQWYLEHNPDVAEAGVEPLGHYLRTGRREQRSPSLWFDPRWFAEQWQLPVAEAWALYCALAPRSATAPSPYFDAPWYRQQHADLRESAQEALTHFLLHGAREGRDPNPHFAARWYRQKHPQSAANPLQHYLEKGAAAGLDPHPEFSLAGYRSRYPEIVREGLEPLGHYLRQGRSEGRQTSPLSDTLSGLRPRATVPESPSVDAQEPSPQVLEQAQALLGPNPTGRFSIIMPCWNRAEVVGDAIRSVLAQSYPHWELIICDDGSTDGSPERIRTDFASEMAEGRIRLIEAEHAGVSAARNTALAQASGDWVAYLDSDNHWLPDYLLLTAAAFQAQPQNATHYAALRVDDRVRDKRFQRARRFDWDALLRQNYIDLNVFAHHRRLYTQLGGFDQSLRRLVDWDLILRYTERHPPAFSPYVLADYHVAEHLNNITLREPLERNELAVRRKFLGRPIAGGPEQLRLAYVIWDWPALSQTFVMAEIEEWLRRGADVQVYFHTAPDRATSQAPQVKATQVQDAEALAQALQTDGRNWVHAHFAYPTVTRLVWPACEAAGLPFSYMPHAVDIFHHANRERNRVGELSQSPHCARVFVHGDYHRDFLVERGVPAEKISYTAQACDLEALLQRPVQRPERQTGEPLRLVSSARLIEKKGLHHLLQAMAGCSAPVQLKLFGYGPMEEQLRAQAQELGLSEQVDFAGAYEGLDAFAAALAAADLFCLPCCEAENGDLDGMPTVFFEAMALGVPVLSTHVSAIPEYINDGISGYLVPPADPATLARKLESLAQLNQQQLAAVGMEARRRLPGLASAARTVDTLQDVFCAPPLDLFMVSFHRGKYGEWPATERAVRTVLQHTSTPFTLTIVDNASDAAFLQQLEELVGDDPRVRLIRLPENRYCGPASNVAIEMARSECAIYVCSNEGLILRRGWERPLLDAMRRQAKAALGGHLASSPKWFDGQSYAQQSWIGSFRNAGFARQNPKRPFHHVQGGLFVLRTRIVQEAGGFSPQRPQDLMDVELSFYLESLGYELLDIPAIAAVSNKTRPNLEALIDESSLALHPVFDSTLALAQHVQKPDAARCNLCGWMGQIDRAADSISFDCPDCQSSPRDRALYRALADSNLHHRGLRLSSVGLGQKLQQLLQPMFQLVGADETTDVDLKALPMGRPSRVLGIAPQLNTES